MKSKFIVILACILAVYALPTLTACGVNRVDISVRCYYDYDHFSLPLNKKGFMDGPDDVRFETEMTLSELKNLIDDTDYGNAKIQTFMSERMIGITKTDVAGKTHYYLVRDKGNGVYMLGNCCQGSGSIVPFYYLEYREEWHYNLYLREDTVYKTLCGIEKFAEFYERLEEFKVSIDGNILVAEMVEPIEFPQRSPMYCRIMMRFTDEGVTFFAEDLST